MKPEIIVDSLLNEAPTCPDCKSPRTKDLGDNLRHCGQCTLLWDVSTGQQYGRVSPEELADMSAEDSEPASPEVRRTTGQPGIADILGDDDAVDWNQWNRWNMPDPEPIPLEAKRKHLVFEHDPFIIIKMPADEEFIRREGFDMEHPFVGSTRVVTREGRIPIKDLFARQSPIDVLSCRAGEQLELPPLWTEATFHCYPEQPVVRVTLRRDDKVQVLDTTARHRWYVTHSRTDTRLVETQTAMLQPGQCIPAVAEGVAHATEPWVVVSVEPTDRFESVYCAVVPTTGVFVVEDNILTGNCLLVAYREYCERLKTGEQVQFSLVDTRDGLPKVDFELSLKRSSYGGPVTKPVFTQIRGKRNQCPPADEYLPALMAFFEAHPEWQLAGHGVRNFDGDVDGDKVLARWRQLQRRNASGKPAPGAGDR